MIIYHVKSSIRENAFFGKLLGKMEENGKYSSVSGRACRPSGRCFREWELVDRSGSGKTVRKRKAGARISAVRCLTCGGSEESYGLDSFFCDIAALVVIPPDRTNTRLTIQTVEQAAGKNGRWISAPADPEPARRERGRSGAEIAEQTLRSFLREGTPRRGI